MFAWPNKLIKSRSLSMVRVTVEKPKERDRDGTGNTYNTSVGMGTLFLIELMIRALSR